MSTPDEIREHNEQVLRNIDRVDRVHKFWKSLGATDEQAATTAAAHADKFTWNGATLEFQGKAVADPANGVLEFFEKNNLSFLLPPKENGDKPDVDADMLASAKSGNMTAYSRIVKQHGKAAADKLIEHQSMALGEFPHGYSCAETCCRHHQGARHWRGREHGKVRRQDTDWHTIEGRVT
jgi:hypothetical protein